MVPENWKIRMEMLKHLARMSAGGEGPPSVREVGEAVGLKSSQTAYKHLKKLEEAGYVEKEGSTRRARGIRLTDKGWEAAGEMPLGITSRRWTLCRYATAASSIVASS